MAPSSMDLLGKFSSLLFWKWCLIAVECTSIQITLLNLRWENYKKKKKFCFKEKTKKKNPSTCDADCSRFTKILVVHHRAPRCSCSHRLKYVQTTEQWKWNAFQLRTAYAHRLWFNMPYTHIDGLFHESSLVPSYFGYLVKVKKHYVIHSTGSIFPFS